MTRHILKILWNRKRSNALILVELLVSFLVLCIVLSIGAYYLENWRKPLGFDYHDVWQVNVSTEEYDFRDFEARGRLLDKAREVIDAMKSHPEVEAAAPLNNTPFNDSRSQTGFYLHGEIFQYLWSQTRPELLDVFRLEMLQGRWLEDADEEVPYTPIVVSASLARTLFGDEDPIGKLVEGYDKAGKKEEPEDESAVKRVIGVFSVYRKYGEFAPAPPAAFVIQHLHDPQRGFNPRRFLLRVAPGTPAAFEEKLVRSLEQVAPTWSFNVTPLEVIRARHLRRKLTPLVIAATVAGFLIIMVGMGLVGVLWQNVTQRTEELGLRRALGATGPSVMRQVLGEILALTGVAMVLGGIVFLQVPVLGFVQGAELKIVLTGMAAAVVVMVPFVSFCGLYPSWLATRVTPSRALQYE